jgi:phospholipid-transporting ATPase
MLLLRGTSLKNTDWIYGLVVYTGHETKIMKNSSKTRTKFSRIEVQTNKEIILVFLFQILVCLGGAAASVMWSQTNGVVTNSYLAIK